MKNLNKLDPVKHKLLRIRTPTGYAHAKQSCFSPIVPSELDSVATNFPVVFIKDGETGKFSAVALFGLTEGENLFVSQDGNWLATYAPSALDIYPFSLRPVGNDHLLYVYEHADVCGTEVGERIFSDDGSPTPFLNSVQGKLKSLVAGETVAADYFDILLRHKVLKEFAILTTLQSGKSRRLQGIYTADKDQLTALADEQILELHHSGALAFATICTTSLAQVTALVQRHNAMSDDPIINIEAAEPGNLV